ncbi:MAG TPA: F0F1 ATP synthase subunit gamma [Streptosporangiaceae bacterium]|jgi:F-type H+-transporting ATPase subunit gamma|nr:F0F1 ATP synthase subunit gamma [Streptosporangiaceae bacterium]
MGAQLRAVRRRIRSVQSTAKITRAQELIASSRIIKAQQRLHDAAPYARELTQAVEAVVSRSEQIDHPLTRPAENPTRAAVVILTSDRGFCGGFNSNVLREAQSLRALLEGQHVEPVIYVAGRKGIGWHRFRGRDTAAEWSGFSDTPRQENAAEITRALLEAYERPTEDGGVDEIHVVYTKFVTMLTQQAVVHRLLPLEIEETDEEPPTGPMPIYEFEPSPEDVLNALLPWYVESRLFQALLESAASEIAARRRAMKSATDNANDLIEQLSREANKARQAEITQEISEIVGGANALADATRE